MICSLKLRLYLAGLVFCVSSRASAAPASVNLPSGAVLLANGQAIEGTQTFTNSSLPTV